MNLLSPGSNEEENDHLIINFKYTDGDDVFYSIEEREGLLDGEQDNSKQSMVDSVFFLKSQHKPGYMDECLRKYPSRTKVFTFACDKVETFFVCYGKKNYIGTFCHGKSVSNSVQIFLNILKNNKE